MISTRHNLITTGTKLERLSYKFTQYLECLKSDILLTTSFITKSNKNSKQKLMLTPLRRDPLIQVSYTTGDNNTWTAVFVRLVDAVSYAVAQRPPANTGTLILTRPHTVPRLPCTLTAVCNTRLPPTATRTR